MANDEDTRRQAARDALVHFLDHVRLLDSLPDLTQEQYAARYRLLIRAHLAALDAGIASGIRIDLKEPEWPVLFIELPTGQASWHMTQHPTPWDGHTNDQKEERIRAFLALVYAEDREDI